MTTRQPDWQTLSAYVDGELSAAEAAEVARALADDRTLAEIGRASCRERV